MSEDARKCIICGGLADFSVTFSKPEAHTPAGVALLDEGDAEVDLRLSFCVPCSRVTNKKFDDVAADRRAMVEMNVNTGIGGSS